MIVGFVSDAHGNPLGLDRCLDALREAGAERIYFLGDSIGYMPDGNEVLSRLKSVGALCIRGNHEEMLLGNLEFTPAQDAVYRIGEARTRLDPRWTDWIEEWPLRREVVIEDLRFLLVHGSPLDPVAGYVYPDADLSTFSGLPFDFMLLGHTHRPFIRTIGSATVVNAGSCGLPRDVGNLACCAVCDTQARTAKLVRVEFDAQHLLASLGERIHESVAACLQRQHSIPAAPRRIDA